VSVGVGAPWVALVESGEGRSALRIQPGPAAGGPTVVSLGLRAALLDGGLDDRRALGRSTRRLPPDAPDAELVLAAFVARGRALLPELRGRFSLLLWDGTSDTLLALRDPMGARPLFWSRSGRTVALSPFLGELLRLPGADRGVSPVVAAAQVLSLPPAQDETLFGAVRRVPAGRLLRVRAGSPTLESYWDPPIGEGPPRTVDEVQEEFEDHLHRAVERCVPAGPAGVFLSGGLDSATVTTAALTTSSARGEPPPAAVSVFRPSPEANEEHTQRSVARRLGLTHHTTTVEDAFPGGGALRASLELASATGAPPGPLASVFDAVAARAVRAGSRTLLTGDGGDEWLMPAPEWAAERLLRLDVRALHSLWRAACRYYPHGGSGTVAREILWKWAGRPLLAAATRQGLARLAPDLLKRERGRRTLAGLPAWLAPAPALRRDLIDWVIDRSPVQRPLSMHTDTKRAWLRHSGVSMLMEDMFMTGRRLGAEVRMPLHDPDLVAFLLSLPPGRLLQSGRAKAPSRLYLARRFGSTDWPPIAYSDSVWDLMMARERLDAWAGLRGINVLSGLGVVDPGSFVPLLQRGPAARGYSATHMWEALSLESWLIGVTVV
jgi:asparagine synthetase B (glutamine-hydrolysing)